MKLFIAFFFIHCYVFGQTDKIIEYNTSNSKLYECLNLQFFHNSEYDYHIRLNIQNSILLDIWQENEIYYGHVYKYMFQEKEQLLNREFVESNTYVFQIDTLDERFVNQIVHKMDSLSLVDSIHVEWLPMCQLGPSGFFIFENKKLNNWSYLRIPVKHIIDFVPDDFIRFDQSDFPYGFYFIHSQCLWLYNPMKINLSGVSAQYSSREEQNFDSISKWNSDFEIRNNKLFQYEWLDGSYPENIYKITVNPKNENLLIKNK